MIDDARILGNHKEAGNNNDDIYNEDGSGVTTFYSDEEAALSGHDDGGVLQIGSFYSAGGLRAWLAYLRRKWFKRKRLLWLLAVVLVFLLLVAIILLATLPSGNSSGASSPAPPVGAGYVRAQRGAVATENGLCSDIGTTIMRDLGGNAVDAAVASCLCIGVLNSFSSGIGGGGVLLLHTKEGHSELIDFREVAPSAASQDMYRDRPVEASRTGGLSVAVPGELAGLEYAWQQHGSGHVAWKDLVMPSAQLARNFTVPALLAKWIADTPEIVVDPGLRSVYAPDGVRKKEGDTVSNPRLADTLALVAENGASAFYSRTSSLAQQLVADIQQAGGIITADDLHNYLHNGTVKVRTPVKGFYRGLEVLSAGPPFGGACVVMALNLLEAYNLPLLGPTAQAYHWVAEALAFAYADRMGLADPQFADLHNLTHAMLSKEHAGRLRRRLRADKTFPYTHYEDMVNLIFGSKVLSPSTGVVLNSQMDDFSIPGRANAYDLPPSEANFIRPGKRPLSSMSPSIVLKDGEVYLIVGASGGSRIITGTLQTFLNVVDYRQGLWKAVSRPRVHHQLLPTDVYTETGFAQDIIRELAQRGHQMGRKEEIAVVQAVLVESKQADDENAATRVLHAVSDPRKHGRPAGF
ncbi:gammaglutamyltransferase [Acanthamoeba castellanii str. Neff]|uniref:Gammaglutamyltransferase n=1 Tax=Acanthamoeba castellanii (strain ATCC 30010 / Neff) TaxID=1257118 RepID=L8HJI6_ACACF|nr:gammaglutamyltransferase [Acanthamoeba castellanii str. Neff]ELR25365.1 gammaglutamyltransferase [Acanthamoeba castellanii str. Neff]